MAGVSGRSTERRQFGRRQTALHGWVCVEGRPRLPCLVRNLSIKGAMLEFDTPSWLPFRFRLVLDVGNFESECEIKHQRPKAIGVHFVTPSLAAVPVRENGDEIDHWTGSDKPGPDKPQG